MRRVNLSSCIAARKASQLQICVLGSTKALIPTRPRSRAALLALWGLGDVPLRSRRSCLSSTRAMDVQSRLSSRPLLDSASFASWRSLVASWRFNMFRSRSDSRALRHVDTNCDSSLEHFCCNAQAFCSCLVLSTTCCHFRMHMANRLRLSGVSKQETLAHWPNACSKICFACRLATSSTPLTHGLAEARRTGRVIGSFSKLSCASSVGVSCRGDCSTHPAAALPP
mmetsp:Transcript_15507/g.35468  ORF Transcript_15507/g.35468 Transcript_15507/m.35468 type:complete len:226 (+) Transcript_15507:33-710(+)